MDTAHIRQDIPRLAAWPEDTLLGEKLYGGHEQLETASFVRQDEVILVSEAHLTWPTKYKDRWDALTAARLNTNLK